MICFSYADRCHLPLSGQWPGESLVAREKLSYWNLDACFQDFPHRSPLYISQLCCSQYYHQSEGGGTEQLYSCPRRMCTAERSILLVGGVLMIQSCVGCVLMNIRTVTFKHGAHTYDKLNLHRVHCYHYQYHSEDELPFCTSNGPLIL